MNCMIKIARIIALLAVTGCSDSQDRNPSEQQKGDHVWKDQVEMLDKAKELEDTALEAAEKRRKQIKNQGG